VLFRSPLGRGRIEPAAAQRLTARPGLAVLASVLIAFVATEGGILLSLQKPWPTSFFISSLSFAFYVAARVRYAIRR
jgi:zinc/manganese transport system permease protein